MEDVLFARKSQKDCEDAPLNNPQKTNWKNYKKTKNYTKIDKENELKNVKKIITQLEIEK